MRGSGNGTKLSPSNQQSPSCVLTQIVSESSHMMFQTDSAGRPSSVS